jgi:predicted DNA-binding transcriptional regulator AlpA
MESIESSATKTEKPKYIRTPDVERLYGIKKSFLYQLIRSGRLPSVLLKGKSATWGIRLFKPDDIESFIEQMNKESAT